MLVLAGHPQTHLSPHTHSVLNSADNSELVLETVARLLFICALSVVLSIMECTWCGHRRSASGPIRSFVL